MSNIQITRRFQKNKNIPPQITGQAIHGDGRGRKLGFPTANLKLNNPKQRPPEGVYACLAHLHSSQQNYYQATLHVGPRPTFPGAAASIEVYLINLPDRDLYGEKITLTDLVHLRSIKKFNSTNELTQALADDVKKAQYLLK